MAETRGAERSNRHQSSQQQDMDGTIQGLTPEQIQTLAQKIYDLLLEELRIEQERHGAGNFGRGG